MSETTLREHALRVAVLKVISDEAVRAYKAARDDAQAGFGPARDEGQSQQRALLPDGTEIGLISVKAPARRVGMPDGALEAWVRGHLPGGMEDYADPDAVNTAEVLDVLKAVFPHLVKSRIRPATRAALLKEVEESGGYLVDQETGDKEKVAEVTDGRATGEFAFRPSRDARDKVIAAWQRGELRGAVPFALPEGGEG